MSTLNVTTIQHESASGNNIVLDSDGSVEIADGITAKEANFNVADNAGVSITEDGRVPVTGNDAVGFRINKDSIFGYEGAGAATVTINNNGSSSFKGALEVDRSQGSETGVIIREAGTARTRLYANGNIQTAGSLTATNGLFTEETGINWRISSKPDGAGGSSAMYIGNARIATSTRSTIWLDPDNPANFNDKNEYVGETLDVKEELQALRARATQQDAVIAQMVTALRSQGVTIDTTEVKE